MIARVFPRRTKATPDDAGCFFGVPDLFARSLEIEEVHVSVTFTWDLERAKRLRDAWEKIATAKIGGPALARLNDGMASEEFVPGRYLKRGYVITSRGCPRNCWFCRVPQFVGKLRLLPIRDGWKVQDDNLLACGRQHFTAVIEMLKRQPRAPEFTGGLEAILLKDWHVHLMAGLGRVATCFFAYDPGDHYESLANAARLMIAANICGAGHRLRCYVLIGWPDGAGPNEYQYADTLTNAWNRLMQMKNCGYTPMAMLWRDPQSGEPLGEEWKSFARSWIRPAAIHATTKGV